ncbi:MAG: hypothetical protein NVS4B8_26290 [Herpetosiphon sp.]
MAKLQRGRAGREHRRAEVLDNYGDDVALLLMRQLRPRATDRLAHLGFPGIVPLLGNLAPRVQEGSVTALVYTYDELQEAQVALARFPHVRIVNEWDEIKDGDGYDIVTVIAPFYLGDDYVDMLITQSVTLLKRTGTLFVAGDKRFHFEHYAGLLGSLASSVAVVATNSHGRVLQAAASSMKRRGTLAPR